ncbi:hypothetical protein K0M31_004353 [Melipona bicolor]|uniref:Uncharacterized protein n=1 Tax=Melipona bicolor TaxID=60889 RepID=A0AA40FWX5_9HYME|nr:hypothetical protein K0M31_004353 [Melipona bicolor]
MVERTLLTALRNLWWTYFRQEDPTTRFHTDSYLVVGGDEGENMYLEFDRASKGERCGWVFWVGAMQRDALWEISRARWLLSKVRESRAYDFSEQRANENPKKLYRAGC